MSSCHPEGGHQLLREKIARLQNLPIFMIFASALSDQIIVLGQINCLIEKC